MLKELVINTTPLISLLAGLGNLEVLPFLYSKVHVPFAVCQEILVGGKSDFGVSAFVQNDWLIKHTQPITISPLLRNSLDLGEASVIELALQRSISLVCIDEAAGRRVARLSGLELTGTVGILVKAKQKGYSLSVNEALKSMRSQGIWLSDGLVQLALKQSGEL
jgi:predicted nucleic acid-binding protein